MDFFNIPIEIRIKMQEPFRRVLIWTLIQKVQKNRQKKLSKIALNFETVVMIARTPHKEAHRFINFC